MDTEQLEEGRPAPDFTLPTTEGREVALHSFRGHPIVIYFYPQDDTPGCTTQACGLRDVYGEITRAGAVVLGVSPDPVESHAEFARKFDLPFLLLSDEDHAVSEQYKVWVEREYQGRKYQTTERSTFIVGPDGILRHIWRRVKPDTHADKVLAAIHELSAPASA